LKSHEPIQRSSIVSNPSRKMSSLRCSRPLCSSQSTGGTLPAPPSPAAGKDPEGSSPRRVSGPSGPNSVQAPDPFTRTVPTGEPAY